MRKGTTKVEQILNAKASVQEFIQRTHRHFIGGEWVPAASGETMDDIDPSTRGVLTQVAREFSRLVLPIAHNSIEHGPFCPD